MFGLGLQQKKDKRQELKFRMRMYKKQKSQEDHKAYIMMIYLVQLPNEEGDMHII